MKKSHHSIVPTMLDSNTGKAVSWHKKPQSITMCMKGRREELMFNWRMDSLVTYMTNPAKPKFRRYGPISVGVSAFGKEPWHFGPGSGKRKRPKLLSPSGWDRQVAPPRDCISSHPSRTSSSKRRATSTTSTQTITREAVSRW